MRHSFSFVLVLVTILLPANAWAQQPRRTAAALMHVEGELYVNDRAAGPATPVVLPDDATVRVTQGRAVIGLKRGGFLFLDSGSSVRVFANGVYNFNRLEVRTGSAIVASDTSAPLVVCENDNRLSDAGVFRFDVQQGDSAAERYCHFRVFEGAAAVPLVSVTAVLRAGQTMKCKRRCGDMVPTVAFPREQLDDFDRWSRQLRERLTK